MKNTLCILFLAACLSGCSDYTMNRMKVTAENYCACRGGVLAVFITGANRFKIMCVNGQTVFDLSPDDYINPNATCPKGATK